MVYGHICQWTGHTDGPINNKVGARKPNPLKAHYMSYHWSCQLTLHGVDLSATADRSCLALPVFPE